MQVFPNAFGCHDCLFLHNTYLCPLNTGKYLPLSSLPTLRFYVLRNFRFFKADTTLMEWQHLQTCRCFQ